MLSTMVVLWVEGRAPRGSAGLSSGLVLCSLLSGCILDNPKFDLDSTTFGTVDGSTSEGVTSSTGGETEATGGTQSASGTTTSGEPTSGEPTSSTTGTSTAGTITDGTTTTTATSTTGDDTTDSQGTTGGMFCEPMDQIDVFFDGDMDGYGGEPKKVCPDQVPEGYIPQGGDCDDSASNVYPGATETCDGADNNCNGLKDEYSAGNTSCDLVEDLFNKVCFLSAYEGHFYYTCKAKRFPPDADGICSGFAVADGAKSYHVKIESEGENQAVTDFAAVLGADVSIGLRDTGGFNLSKDHKWVEGNASLTYGSTLGQPPWGPGQPDKLLETWTQLSYQSGLWGDIGGLELRSFVCEAEPKP